MSELVTLVGKQVLCDHQGHTFCRITTSSYQQSCLPSNVKIKSRFVRNQIGCFFLPSLEEPLYTLTSRWHRRQSFNSIDRNDSVSRPCWMVKIRCDQWGSKSQPSRLKHQHAQVWRSLPFSHFQNLDLQKVWNWRYLEDTERDVGYLLYSPLHHSLLQQLTFSFH